MKKICVKSEKEIEIFAKFYDEIFTKSFTNKNEYESLENIISLIKNENFNKKHSKIDLYLTDDDEIIAGFIYNNFRDNCAISFLVVKEEYRNKGIGTMIVTNYLKENDKNIFLEIEKDNKSGLKFWKKFGFRIIDIDYIHPNFYGKKEVSLYLAIRTNEIYQIINKDYLKNFIYDYSQIAIGISKPKLNKTVIKLFKEIDSKFKIKILKS